MAHRLHLAIVSCIVRFFLLFKPLKHNYFFFIFHAKHVHCLVYFVFRCQKILFLSFLAKKKFKILGFFFFFNIFFFLESPCQTWFTLRVLQIFEKIENLGKWAIYFSQKSYFGNGLRYGFGYVIEKDARHSNQVSLVKLSYQKSRRARKTCRFQVIPVLLCAIWPFSILYWIGWQISRYPNGNPSILGGVTPPVPMYEALIKLYFDSLNCICLSLLLPPPVHIWGR